MMKARTNILKLGWRSYLFDDVSLCQLCKKELETFSSAFSALQIVRQNSIYLHLPQRENDDYVLEKFLIT